MRRSLVPVLIATVALLGGIAHAETPGQGGQRKKGRGAVCRAGRELVGEFGHAVGIDDVLLFASEGLALPDAGVGSDPIRNHIAS